MISTPTLKTSLSIAEFTCTAFDLYPTLPLPKMPITHTLSSTKLKRKDLSNSTLSKIQENTKYFTTVTSKLLKRTDHQLIYDACFTTKLPYLSLQSIKCWKYSGVAFFNFSSAILFLSRSVKNWCWVFAQSSDFTAKRKWRFDCETIASCAAVFSVAPPLSSHREWGSDTKNDCAGG